MNSLLEDTKKYRFCVFLMHETQSTTPIYREILSFDLLTYLLTPYLAPTYCPMRSHPHDKLYTYILAEGG